MQEELIEKFITAYDKVNIGVKDLDCVWLGKHYSNIQMFCIEDCSCLILEFEMLPFVGQAFAHRFGGHSWGFFMDMATNFISGSCYKG